MCLRNCRRRRRRRGGWCLGRPVLVAFGYGVCGGLVENRRPMRCRARWNKKTSHAAGLLPAANFGLARSRPKRVSARKRELETSSGGAAHFCNGKLASYGYS